MALQIRRGTDVDRQGIVPKAGEPIFTTDTKRLFIGDGSTAGGIIVDTNTGLAELSDDPTPQLAGNLDLNNNDIVGTGNINITGSLTANGTLDLKGSIFADDSTLLVDGVAGTINATVLTGALPALNGSALTGITSTSVTGDVLSSGGQTVLDSGTNGTDATFTGSVTGAVTGDLKGSVFADDSTLIIDSNNAIVTANEFRSTGVMQINAATGLNVNKQNTTHARIDLYSPAATGFGTGFLALNNTHDNQFTNDLTFTRTRGTPNSPTAAQANDKIGGFTAQVWDGSAYQQGVILGAYATNVSAGNLSAKLTILTRNGSAGTLTTKFEVSEDGTIKMDKLSNINGSLTVTGTFNADVKGTLDGDVTGSIFSDSSTMLIDGQSGALMCANVDLTGNVGATPSTPGSVDSWLQVKVNGATKYIPLYD
mgnify:CR=1 FL=1|tara:strand:- start:179 stop:1453 length:1275 start_codon:yes stop_codon:yes gene_type:complete